MIDLREFKDKLRLHPSAILVTGFLNDREKNGFMASNPHYLETGTPQVHFDTETLEPIGLRPFAIQSEVRFSEAEHPIPTIYAGQTPAIILQFTLEGRGSAPDAHLVRMLREFGATCREMHQTKTQVIIAAFPVFTAGLKGMSSGKLYPIGIFSLAGHPIWVNPEGIAGKVIKADYPEYQKERGSSRNAPLGVKGLPDWYEQTIMLAQGKTPYHKQQAVFEARGKYLHAQGKGPYAAMLKHSIAEFTNAGGEVLAPPPPPPAPAKTKKPVRKR
jgi:hypothetical protein